MEDTDLGRETPTNSGPVEKTIIKRQFEYMITTINFPLINLYKRYNLFENW